MEKLEKKAVFSPYCGDETITSYDRAFCFIPGPIKILVRRDLCIC